MQKGRSVTWKVPLIPLEVSVASIYRVSILRVFVFVLYLCCVYHVSILCLLCVYLVSVVCLSCGLSKD